MIRLSEAQTNRLLFFLILILGFFLRFNALSFGLPHLFHADEPIVVNHALLYGSGDLNPHFFRIPPLTSYLLFIFYGIYFIFGKVIGLFPNIKAFESLFYQDPSSFYFLGRFLLGTLPSMLSLYVFYQLVKEHFSEKKALLASFFLATCFLYVKDSHYIYADIPLLLVLLLAVSFYWKIPEKIDQRKVHIFSGLLTGLAVATKYNGGAIAFIYLFLIILTRIRQKELPKAASDLIAFGLSLIAAYSLLNPYSILDFKFFFQELRGEAAVRAGGISFFHHIKYSLLNGLGLPLLSLSFVGYLWSLYKKELHLLSLVLFVSIYFFILNKAAQPYERYVLPLLPFLILLAADFLGDMFDYCLIKPLPRTLITVALSVPSIYACLLFNQIMIAPDSRLEAQSWIESHIPPDSPVALDGSFFMPRLRFTQDQLKEKREALIQKEGSASSKTRRIDELIKVQKNETGYKLYFLNSDPVEGGKFLFETPLVPFDFSALKSQGIHWVVIQRQKSMTPDQNRFYQALTQEAKKITRFSPYKDLSIETNFDAVPMTGGPFLRKELTERKSNGMILEVYQI